METEIADTSGLAPRKPPSIADAVARLYPDILEQPIFAPDRGRRSAPATVSDKPESEGGAATSSPGSRLIGLALGAGVRTAVVRGSDGRSRLIRNGDQVDGWTVRGIAADGVYLQRETRRKVLRMPGDEREADTANEAEEEQ